MAFEHPQTWCETQFSGAQLSDKRRLQRVIRVATALAEQPGKSLPQLFRHPYDLKAAYNLFKHPDATPDRLQAGHRKQIQERLHHEAGVYLLLEDTSELSWSESVATRGLGPIGEQKGHGRGFLLHSVLAVRWVQLPTSGKRPPLEILGLADQQFHIRQPVPRSETKWGPSRNLSGPRYQRWRESALWQQATGHLGNAPISPDTRWVRVCDRGADIYEFLDSCRQYGHGYVIRAAQDRAVVDEQGYITGHLFEQARQALPLGGFSLHLRSRPQQPARKARLWVSAIPVALRAPQRPGRMPGVGEPICCTAVRVWEEGGAGLEWILLVDEPVRDFEVAMRCALQYATRWVIEEFHKALKTGLRVERLQLETAQRLFAAIAIMSVVALRLLDLRELVRATPQAPASQSGLSLQELKVLSAYLGRKLRTVCDVALAVAKLGGHLNRKGDGMPGWQTLWLGLKELQALVAGATLGLNSPRFG